VGTCECGSRGEADADVPHPPLKPTRDVSPAERKDSPLLREPSLPAYAAPGSGPPSTMNSVAVGHGFYCSVLAGRFAERVWLYASLSGWLRLSQGLLEAISSTWGLTEDARQPRAFARPAAGENQTAEPRKGSCSEP